MQGIKQGKGSSKAKSKLREKISNKGGVLPKEHTQPHNCHLIPPKLKSKQKKNIQDMINFKFINKEANIFRISMFSSLKILSRIAQ